MMDTLMKASVSSASYFLSSTPLSQNHSDMVETTGLGSPPTAALQSIHHSTGVNATASVFKFPCTPAYVNYPRPRSLPVTSTIFSNTSASALTISTSNTAPPSCATSSTASYLSLCLSPSVMAPSPNTSSQGGDTPGTSSSSLYPAIPQVKEPRFIYPREVERTNHAQEKISPSLLQNGVDWNSNEQSKESSRHCEVNHDEAMPLQEKRWVRPLSYAENFMTNAHSVGCMATVYSLWLESRQPISFQTIKRTASVMYRKMPNLRMSVGYRNGVRWWKEMNEEKIDVESLKTDDVMKTFELLLRKKYNMDDGPMWFVRLVTLTDSENVDTDTNHNLKYKYVCIFGFHHNVSDGTTNMKFCKVFLSVLNDFLQGKGVDCHQEGIFAPPLQDKLSDKCTTTSALIKLFISRFYKGILSYGAYVNNFTQFYRMPSSNEAKTNVLHRELDDVTTSKLLKRCKMEKVTLNSAFTAAANLGLYTLILKKTNTIKKTSFNSVQAINMRRYWPAELRKDTFGCHISMLDMAVPTDIEDFDNFWEYARKVHKIIKYELDENKRALKVTPISERLMLIVRSNSILSSMGAPSTNDNHYCVTNMGNLSSTFPGTGDEVEVSKVIRSVSGHLMPSLCQHTLQTFRGRLCYSLDYYSQKLTPEVANAYVGEIISLLKNRIHAPN